MPRLDKLTIKAQEALQAAQEIGARSGQQQIEPLHLLWALIAQNEGVVPPLLEKLGVSPATLAGEVETQMNRLPKISDVSQQYLSPATNKVLDKRVRRSPTPQGRIRFDRAHSARHCRRFTRPRRPIAGSSWRDP